MFFFNVYMFTQCKMSCKFLAKNNIPKTNNAIEAYHSNLKKSFSCCRYNFINLIHYLKIEEDAARVKYYRLKLGYRLRRNENYARIENDLREFLSQNTFGNSILFILQ